MKRLILFLILCTIASAQTKDTTTPPITIMHTPKLDSLISISDIECMSRRDTTHYPLQQIFWQQTFTDINGNTIAADTLKGKFIYIHFWNNGTGWYQYNRLKRYLKGNEDTLKIISIVKPQDIDSVKKISERRNIKWPQIILPGNITEKEFLKNCGIILPQNPDFEEMIAGYRNTKYPISIVIFPNSTEFALFYNYYEFYFRNYVK